MTIQNLKNSHSKTLLFSCLALLLWSSTLVAAPAAGSDAWLEVQLASSTPSSSTVPQGGFNIPFLELDITNHGSETVAVVGLEASRSGLGDENDIDEVKIFDGFTQVGSDRGSTEDEEIAPLNAHHGLGDEDDIDDVKVFDGLNQRGSDRGFTQDEHIAPLNLSVDPIMIPPGATKTVLIAADLKADSVLGNRLELALFGPHQVAVLDASNGAPVPVTGDFPLIGNEQEIGSVEVGSLDFEFLTVADDELEVGETNVELCRVRVTAGPAEDVLIQAVTLEFEGIDDGAIGNLYLEHQGKRISNIVDPVTRKVTSFDFTGLPDGGWLLEDGDTRTFRCRGDILGGVDDTVTAQFDEVETDVIATGLRFGFGVSITEAQTAPDSINILGGDITFTINSTARDFATDTDNLSWGTFSSTSRDVAPDTDNVEAGALAALSSTSRDVAPDSDEVSWGTLTISNFGEAVELEEDFTILIEVLDGHATAIQDVRLVDKETGSTFMGPADPNSILYENVDGRVGEIAEIVFRQRQRLGAKSQRQLALVASISADAPVGAKVRFALDMSTVEVEGINSNDTSTGGAFPTGPHEITPAGNPTTRTYTLGSTHLPALDLMTDVEDEDGDDAIVEN